MKEKKTNITEWERVKRIASLCVILFCSASSIFINGNLFLEPFETIASPRLDFTDLEQTANLKIWNETCKVVFHNLKMRLIRFRFKTELFFIKNTKQDQHHFN